MPKKLATKKPARTKKPIAKTAPTKTKKTTRTVKTRAAAPTPPASRRAVFIDVENTSSETTLLRVLDHLKIDRKAQPTEILAAGNWKSVGAKVGRMLAGLGAQLVHSAPAVGVRDWSDLWIAVAAGRWLATAVPGDMLDLVSDDRAFDAVGDAAAAAGVEFRRISYRSIPASPASAEAAPVAAPSAGRRRRRGRGRPDTPAGAERTHARPTVEVPLPSSTRPHAEPGAPPPSGSEEEAHAASHEHIRAALARLAGGTTRWTNLDVLANALKAEGFTRPPGSPRLVTRLRKMKDVEVSPNGMVRLRTETPLTTTEPMAAAPEAAPQRPRRRGGRRRRRSPASGNAALAPPNDAAS